MPSISDFRKMTDDDLENYGEVGSEPNLREYALKMLDRRLARQMVRASKDMAVLTGKVAHATIALCVITGLSLIGQIAIVLLSRK